MEAKGLEQAEQGRSATKEQLEELKRRRDELREKLGDLKGASAAVWEDARTGVANAWRDSADVLNPAFQAI